MSPADGMPRIASVTLEAFGGDHEDSILRGLVRTADHGLWNPRGETAGGLAGPAAAEPRARRTGALPRSAGARDPGG